MLPGAIRRPPIRAEVGVTALCPQCGAAVKVTPRTATDRRLGHGMVTQSSGVYAPEIYVPDGRDSTGWASNHLYDALLRRQLGSVRMRAR